MTDWWLSTDRMTIWCREENGLVIDGAPIIKRFIGQPAANLKRWLEAQGGYQSVDLSTTPTTPSESE